MMRRIRAPRFQTASSSRVPCVKTSLGTQHIHHAVEQTSPNNPGTTSASPLGNDTPQVGSAGTFQSRRIGRRKPTQPLKQLYSPPSSKPDTRLISDTDVRKMVALGGFRPTMGYNVAFEVNEQILQEERFIKPRSIQLEALMRMFSLYPYLHTMDQWRKAYAEICQAKENNRPVSVGGAIPLMEGLRLDLLAKIQADCLGDFRDTWDSLSKPAKATHWIGLITWLLEKSPELALEFLLVTTNSRDRPNYIMVADAFLYLDTFYYESLLKNWKKDAHTYESVLKSCLNPRTWPILDLPQKGTRLYLMRTDSEAANFAWDIMIERKTNMTSATALCFMNRFTEFGDIDRAIQALGYIPKLKNVGFELNSERVSRHCCKLLTLDSVEGKGQNERNFRILPRLLKMGVRPDRGMMNVVLSNAFKTGDPRLGMDILKFMREQGHELDSYSYISVLSDAVAHGDRERVNALIQEIDQHEDLKTNQFIASKLFHAHYVFTAKQLDTDANPREVFYSMLDKYNQLHDITPLKELSLVPLHYTPPLGSSNTPPTMVALYIMIATYFRCQKRISSAQRIYTRFRSLVLQGHEVIAPLAATDHTYNEFLIAFRHDPAGLRWCVRLVEDMLQTGSVNLANQDTAIAHAKPTVRTWTMLLSAFIYNKQPLAAEKVKEMMAKHGVKFNEVTWNIVISGYANSQNVSEVAKALKLMEKQGYTIDEHTMKSLRYLRDPERLWVAIKELDKAAAAAGFVSRNPSKNDSASDEKDAKEYEALLDQGLRRLEAKLNTKQ